jgi:hypothetical protein
MKLLINILLTLSLFSCANNDKQKNANSAKDTSDVVSNIKSAVSPTNDNYFNIAEDSITILPFEIEVVLSPKAEERITKGKETIIVDVFFTGTPKDSSLAELEEDGSFFVASAKKEILYGQVAKFDKIKFSKKIYNQLTDKDIDLGVNVYSGRKSSQDNLLNGDALFDKVSNVVNKRFTLKCKLIYGDN